MQFAAGLSVENELGTLKRLLSEAENIVGFTGAGISTECGVPDFRSPGSPWTKHKPIPYAEFMTSAEARAEAWRRKFHMDDLYRDAQPGKGHQALKALVDRGHMSCVITQNIDNLHQVSGIKQEKIIELHGNGSFATCVGCGKRFELHWVREYFEPREIAPDCDDCGSPIKSATVSFGQPMPKKQMELARKASLSADLFLCIGTSLVVYPAATLPIIAKENGAKLVIINGESTTLDILASLVVRADIGTVLQAAMN